MTPSDVPCVSVHYQPTHNYVYYHEQILKIYGNGMDPPDFSEQPSHYGNRTRVRRMVRKRESNALTARFCSNSEEYVYVFFSICDIVTEILKQKENTINVKKLR